MTESFYSFLKRSKDASGFTLRSELLYVSEPEAQTYVKGQIWAENFVPRAQWEARLPLGIENYFHHEGTGVIGHHTHWDRCYDIVDCIKEVKKVQDYHMDGNGWWDIGYNFLIGEDGRIYEGRGFHIQGSFLSDFSKTEKFRCALLRLEYPDTRFYDHGQFYFRPSQQPSSLCCKTTDGRNGKARLH